MLNRRSMTFLVVTSVGVLLFGLAAFGADVCGTAECSGGMCTYTLASAYWVGPGTMSNNAMCAPASNIMMPMNVVLMGTGTGANASCSWSIKAVSYVYQDKCIMTPADGLPVELLEFSVESDDPPSRD